MTEASKSSGLVSESQPFWDAIAQNKLLIKRCLDTSRCFFYPRERSPFTGGKTEWVPASGRGVVYSCSLSTRPTLRCLAYVKLAEGPIILTHIVGENLQAVAIGDTVQVSFDKVDGKTTMPVFSVIR
jgi:uncharacterized protein